MNYNLQTLSLGSRIPRICNGDILLSQPYYDTMLHVANATQAPFPIILSSVISTLSLLIQGLIDVKKPSGQTVPVSMFVLVMAESGERKSSVLNALQKMIIVHDQQEQLLYEQSEQELAVQQEIWLQRRKQIMKSIIASGSDDLTNSDEYKQLVEHEKKKPMPYKRIRLIYSDTTPSALLLGMHENSKNAGLISSEGGNVLNGKTMGDLPSLNELWSGNSIMIDRKSSKSFALHEARLTINVMIQRSAFEKYQSKHGEHATGIGLFARFMICETYTTQGSRFISQTPMAQSFEWFEKRVTELLAENKEAFTQNLPRKELRFDAQAHQRWIDWYNATETEIRQGSGVLESVPDYASKLADNTARLAGLLHYFEYGNSQTYININTLEMAISISAWYASEFVYLRLLPEQATQDMNLLEDWLKQQVQHSRGAYNYVIIADMQNNQYIAKRTAVRQYAPNQLRDRERLNKALQQLQALGLITMLKGTDRAHYIALATDVFGTPFFQYPQ